MNDNSKEALWGEHWRYTQAVSVARIGVWEWNLKTNEFYLDASLKQILGYRDEEIANDVGEWFRYFHPDDCAPAADALQAHLDGLTDEYLCEHRMLHKSGGVIWLQARGKAIRNAAGEAVRVIGFDIDITEYKHKEELLNKERKELISIFGGIDELIYVSDPKTYELLYINARAQALFGTDIVEKSCYEAFHGQKKPCVFCCNPALYREQLGYTEVHEQKNRRNRRWYRCVSKSIRWPDQRDVRFELAVDIHDRKQAEQALSNRLRYEEGLARCSKALVCDTQDALEQALSHLLECAEVDRVYVFENYRDSQHRLCTRQIEEVCTYGVMSQIDNPVVQGVPYAAGFKRWETELSQGRAIQGKVADFPSSEREVLELQGILSILVLPVSVKANWFGFVGFDDTHLVKAWSHEDIRLLQTAAEMIGTYIERKAARARLIMSEERYHDLYHFAPDMYFTVLPDGTLKSVNRCGAEALGYTEAELTGRRLWDVIHPEDLERAQAQFADIFSKTIHQSQLDFRKVHKDGSTIWVHDRARLILDQAGRPKELLLVCLDITLRKQMEETIRYQAYHDLLTQLPNRALFNDHLNLALAQARHHQRKLAVMFLDLDRFKTINDSLGHHIGDGLLQRVACLLSSCLREGDTVARQGGDEYTVLLPQITHNKDAAIVAEKIHSTLNQPLNIEGHRLQVTTSIGISIFPDDGTDAATLMKNADIAMYHAKGSGKGTYSFFDTEISRQTRLRMNLESAIVQGLRNNQFELFYQPQVALCTGAITGMEVLLRWRHPELGLLLPEQFIPIAEETGSMIPLGEWVLREACLQNSQWQQEGYSPLRVTVNLSPSQFQRPGLETTIKEILIESGLTPQFLGLEITETVAMQNIDSSISTIRRLKQLGIQCYLDDFGTGYSSLSYLKKLPVDKLKIDKSFVQELTKDRRDTAIVKTIIAMAHCLNVETVAEGVETNAQLRFLRAKRCEEMQGYLISPPLPADRFKEKFLTESRPLSI